MQTAPKKTVKRAANAGAADQKVAQVAYELFLQRGGEHGHDLEDWLRAEAIVRRRNGRARSA